MEHSHDSCTPDLARDLVVAGLVEPVSHGTSLSIEDVDGAKDQPSLTVSPVITVTPFSLTAEVITRSEQVPVVVLLGPSVDPGMSVLRRSLSTAAAAAGLRWILAIVDADRFPQIIAEFRPSYLPTVTVVAGGTGVASWSPHDALGDNGVDISDWVAATVSAVEPRLTGLPAETVIEPSELPDVAGETADEDYLSDPRLHRAADLVGAGEPLAAVDLYDEMLERYSSMAAQQTLRQARAAVRVLVRTQDLDQAAVFTVLSSGQSSERLEGRDLAGVLRTADVFVLADRPADAVDLLSASLAWCSAQEREEIRVRLLDLVLLLETDAPAAVRARMRLASALF